MTGYTRSARQVVAAKFRVVAIRALPRRHRMHSRQGKTGHAVVELPVCPDIRVVAVLATGREPLVRGAVRIVVIGLVARNTSRGGQIEIVVRVAIGAHPRRNRVPASQRKPHRIVIELRIQPVVRSVALIASGRICEGDVIGRGRALEVRLVA